MNKKGITAYITAGFIIFLVILFLPIIIKMWGILLFGGGPKNIPLWVYFAIGFGIMLLLKQRQR